MYSGIRKQGQDRLNEIEESRITGTNPSTGIDNYAGTYTDKLYGKVEVTTRENGLRLSLSKDDYIDLDHWHYDTFRGPWAKSWYGKSMVTFRINTSGDVEALEMFGMKYKKEKESE